MLEVGEEINWAAEKLGVRLLLLMERQSMPWRRPRLRWGCHAWTLPEKQDVMDRIIIVIISSSTRRSSRREMLIMLETLLERQHVQQPFVVDLGFC